MRLGALTRGSTKDRRRTPRDADRCLTQQLLEAVDISDSDVTLERHTTGGRLSLYRTWQTHRAASL